MLQSLFILPSRQRAVAELMFAAALWGFGFIAARWTLMGIGPLWSSSFRFLIAFGCAIPFVWRYPLLRSQAGRGQFRLSAIPGLLIGLTLLLQMYALQYTTVTRSGFITALYIVFVPLFEWPFFGRRVSFAHAVWVSMAVLGAGLICQVETGGDWNRGDLLTLACSITAAFHILRLEAIAPRIESSFVFNVYQSFWAGLLPTVLAIFLEPLPSQPIPAVSWVGLFTLALLMTLVAFFIQVRTQRVLAPSVASMLFLLESPFAALYAYLIFGEHLDLLQWLGAAFIMTAALGTLRTQPETAPAVSTTI